MWVSYQQALQGGTSPTEMNGGISANGKPMMIKIHV